MDKVRAMGEALRVFVVIAAVLVAAGCAATSGPAAPGAALLETYWRPVEIDGKPVATHAGTRQPHLVLRREGDRVTGFSGCNSFSGSYQESAGTLRFGKLVSTRMACAGEAGNALEAAFNRALDATASYHLAGGVLELRDRSGATRMKLAASSQ